MSNTITSTAFCRMPKVEGLKIFYREVPVRFADDVTFEGTRMPKLVGKQNVIGFLRTILP